MRRLAVLLASTLALAACFSPRGERISRRYAADWHDVLTVEILDSYDLVKNHLPSAEPELTHMIQVLVLDGPDRWVGKTLLLPYDGWALGINDVKRPPAAGNQELVVPSKWVRENREGRGVPHPVWKRKRR